MTSMNLMIAALLLGGTCAAQTKQAPAVKPKPALDKCFKVDSMTDASVPAESRFTVIAHSECPYVTGEVYVAVKYFDKDGYRIGTGLWGTSHVPTGEKLRHTFATDRVQPMMLSRIEVIFITEDAEKAAAFAPREPSTSMVIDNFNGMIRNFRRY